MSTPQNQEHWEAEQLQANLEREKFKKTLSLEDQKKMEAVEDAVKILVNNGVIFFLFPYLPSPFPQFSSRPACWTWHPWDKHMKYDSSGKPTKESQDLLNTVTDSLLATIVAQYFKNAQSPEGIGWNMVIANKREVERLTGKSGDNSLDVEDNKEEE